MRAEEPAAAPCARTHVRQRNKQPCGNFNSSAYTVNWIDRVAKNWCNNGYGWNIAPWTDRGYSHTGHSECLVMLGCKIVFSSVWSEHKNLRIGQTVGRPKIFVSIGAFLRLFSSNVVWDPVINFWSSVVDISLSLVSDSVLLYCQEDTLGFLITPQLCSGINRYHKLEMMAIAFYSFHGNKRGIWSFFLPDIMFLLHIINVAHKNESPFLLRFRDFRRIQ